MSQALQQLINGLTLGAVYGLIAIGYTMVYGIIGMINFAHGDIYMVSAFIAVTCFTLLANSGISSVVASIAITLIVSIALTSVFGWTVERVGYRPLRGSNRLAPLISSIGISIFLQNMVQLTQGARVKSIPPLVTGGVNLFAGEGLRGPYVSYVQILIVVVTILLMFAFTLFINKTPFGRQQRACEQDQRMMQFLGYHVDRIIALTFMIGAALAAVAGVMVTLTRPRPPGPPVLNATAALAGRVKVSRAVGVLTSTAVTASTAVAIIASAATDQRSLPSVIAA